MRVGRKSHERVRIPKDLSTLAARIRYARLCRGYPMPVFCRFTGLKQSAVTAWERGERAVELTSLRKVAYYLEVPMEWLIGESTELPVKPRTALEELMHRSCGVSASERLHRLRQHRPRWLRMPRVALDPR